ncbi:OLC1v1015001C1 [Oldenlandia corymbosa var. corymbosa]|uniref:OLC1v1015001C1 n=1 Tax=Oldenlandia corymbosa var. corymbosa TaxID=529605 RepID=A0AAV1E296_OLDCO|nr:OLC1v1015001C1 [Oldenlandia corymbosa var. corymbosa]
MNNLKHRPNCKFLSIFPLLISFSVSISPFSAKPSESHSDANDFPDVSLFEFPIYRRMSAEEAPFRPREKLLEKQRFFQNIHKHTYLKGRFDIVTSVVIPAALAATCTYMIGRGIYNMSHGIGKKE